MDLAAQQDDAPPARASTSLSRLTETKVFGNLLKQQEDTAGPAHSIVLFLRLRLSIPTGR
jgi:hypothetical protein